VILRALCGLNTKDTKDHEGSAPEKLNLIAIRPSLQAAAASDAAISLMLCKAFGRILDGIGKVR